jgi:DNA polymerase-3 subunit alpha
LEAAAIWRKEREELQIELFDFAESPNWNVDLPVVPPYTQTQMLDLERELMGFYLSGHPLDAFDEMMDDLKFDRLVDIADAPDGSTVFTAGMIVSLKPFVTRKGQSMAFLEMEDRIMGTELVAFPTVWKNAASFVKKGSLVFVRAKVQQGDEDYKLLADDILPLDAADLHLQISRLRRIGQQPRYGESGNGNGGAARSRAANSAVSPAQVVQVGGGAVTAGSTMQRVYILIDAPHEQPATLIRLKLLLKAHSGELATVLRYERERRTVALSDEYRVKESPELFAEIEKLLGEGSIRVK